MYLTSQEEHLVDSDSKVLVIYAYSDGGEIDEHNLRFFIRVAISGALAGTADPAARIDYLISVNGYRCRPCGLLQGVVKKHRPKGRIDVI